MLRGAIAVGGNRTSSGNAVVHQPEGARKRGGAALLEALADLLISDLTAIACRLLTNGSDNDAGLWWTAQPGPARVSLVPQ